MKARFPYITVNKLDKARPKYLMLARVFVVLALLAPSAHAENIACHALLDPQATAAEHFSNFGFETKKPNSLPNRIRLLVWNVFKGGKPGLAEEFKNLSAGADIALLQEMVDSSQLVSELSNANQSLSWTMARSFFQKKTKRYTGVATGSRVEAREQRRLLSPVTEPFTNTPKSALVSDFPIRDTAGREQIVRVINVHAINFVSTAAFKAHIKQVFEVIREHQGPVIFAGDFNTWNPLRTWFLKTGARLLGLEQVHHAPGWFLTLDYIFVRGFKSTSRSLPRGKVTSSDHDWMLLELELDPEYRAPTILNENAQLLREAHPTVIGIYKSRRLHKIA